MSNLRYIAINYYILIHPIIIHKARSIISDYKI